MCASSLCGSMIFLSNSTTKSIKCDIQVLQIVTWGDFRNSLKGIVLFFHNRMLRALPTFNIHCFDTIGNYVWILICAEYKNLDKYLVSGYVSLLAFGGIQRRKS